MTCLPKEQILLDIVNTMLHELSNLQKIEVNLYNKKSTLTRVH